MDLASLSGRATEDPVKQPAGSDLCDVSETPTEASARQMERDYRSLKDFMIMTLPVDPLRPAFFLPECRGAEQNGSMGCSRSDR